MKKTLTNINLIKPFDVSLFEKQLLEFDIPIDSINLLKKNPDSFKWLYDDIFLGELYISEGARYSNVVGIFITDGSHFLLERNSILGDRGEQFKLGGQIPYTENHFDIAYIELEEETPIILNKNNLIYLGETNDFSLTSPKLPGVKSYKKIFHYKYLTSFESIKNEIKFAYLGRDGYYHDLILIPHDDLLEDKRVKDSYKNAFRTFFL